MKLKNPLTILLLLSNLVVVIVFVIALMGHLKPKTKLRPKQRTFLIQDDTQYILFWSAVWGDKTFLFGSEGYKPFKQCKFKNCFATSNREWVRLYRFDAIIFHGSTYDRGYKRPYTRGPHQRYIFATIDSPISMIAAKLYDSYYNWTMTYRLDSDIVFPYGYIIKNTTNYTMPTLELIKHKTYLAAWLVSNCNTTNKRQEIYDNLLKYINIDMYGSCGTLKCPTDHGYSKNLTDCYNFLAKRYKFYLAFESAHCKDYVTEKLYMALERNIVPIVYGYGNYQAVAPPNSVIIVENFPNIQKLAEYILFLDKNPEEYLKYFEWKKDYYVDRSKNRAACQLCDMLNNPLLPRKVYKDLNTWWWEENRNYCKYVPDLTVAYDYDTSVVSEDYQ